MLKSVSNFEHRTNIQNRTCTLFFRYRSICGSFVPFFRRFHENNAFMFLSLCTRCKYERTEKKIN